MSNPPTQNEWDQLVVKMGNMTLAVGALEMAVIAMVCGILGKSEDEVRIRTNAEWCRKLKVVMPETWSPEERDDLASRLTKIRELYVHRNRLVHAALGVAGDGSIAGVPAGSIIDLRTFGIGFSAQIETNTWAIGVVGKRVHLEDIDRLIENVHAARVGLVPYMKLVDKIKHPARPLPMPQVGKRL